MLVSKRVFLATLFTLSTAVSPLASADAGPGGTGGGDEYVLDFVKTAHLEIYPWLQKHGASLKPSMDADRFILAVDPRQISSVDRVFESCDGSDRGREVAACFNAKTGQTYLSRSRYPLKTKSPAKLGVIAHEVFRNMGVEGDGYEVSRQMPIVQSPQSLPREIADDEFLSKQNGVVLTAKADLIFTANSSGPWVKKRKDLWCSVEPQKYEPFDRVFPKGKKLKVVLANGGPHTYYRNENIEPNCIVTTVLKVDSPSIKEVRVHKALFTEDENQCIVLQFSNRVGDFRDCMGNYLGIDALPPVEMPIQLETESDASAAVQLSEYIARSVASIGGATQSRSAVTDKNTKEAVDPTGVFSLSDAASAAGDAR